MNAEKKTISCLILLLGLLLVSLPRTESSYGKANYVMGKAKYVSEKAEYVTENAEYAQGKAINKKIALTFDDGPDGIYTELLLDGLKKRSVKTTFFVMGKKAEEFPDLILKMQKEGHLIGNHTYSHMQYSKNKEDEFKQELLKTNKILFNITGQNPAFVRPPFGTWDKKMEIELNMFPVLWTIDPLDWCSDNAACITRTVVNKAKENDIILMHDQYKTSITAAFMIIDELESRGYEFVTVEEILFD